MGVKLYNKSAWPDKPLKDLLSIAHRQMGLKGDTVVKITPSRGRGGISGTMYLGWPLRWHLVPERDRTKGTDMNMIKCAPGWVRIIVQCKGASWGPQYEDKIDLAQRFYRVALHEFAHVRDYRLGKDMTWKKGQQWKHRRVELRAINATDDIDSKPKSLKLQNAILEVALMFEESEK